MFPRGISFIGLLLCLLVTLKVVDTDESRLLVFASFCCSRASLSKLIVRVAAALLLIEFIIASFLMLLCRMLAGGFLAATGVFPFGLGRVAD